MRKIHDKHIDKSERVAHVTYNVNDYTISISLPDANTEVNVGEARKLVAFGDDLADVEALIFADAVSEEINVSMPQGGSYQPLWITGAEREKINASVAKMEIALKGGDKVSREDTKKARDRFAKITGTQWVTLSDLAEIDDPEKRAYVAGSNARGMEMITREKLQRKAVNAAKLHVVDRRRWLAKIADQIVEKVDALMADEKRWKKLPKRTREHIVGKRARALVQSQSGRILEEARNRIIADHDLDMMD